jgi:hypothetical protein
MKSQQNAIAKVPQALPRVAALYDANESTLDGAERSAENLEREIRRAAMDIDALELDGKKVRLCVDFDVIHAAVMLQRKSAEDQPSFWSSLFLDQRNGSDLVILPGTLYELIQFSRRQQRRSGAFNTDFAEAFEKSFSTTKFNQVDILSTYAPLIERIADNTWFGDSAYLLHLLRDGLSHLRADQLVVPDHEVFYKCVYFLAEGARSHRLASNRADAYNIALISALNRISDSTGCLYALTSVSSEVARLNEFVFSKSDPEKRARKLAEVPVVWRPRKAFIHQLLHAAAGHGSGASVFAWRLVERLVVYRAAITRIKNQRVAWKKNPARTNAGEPRESVSGDDLLIGLLSSVEVLQEKFSSAHIALQERLTEEKVTYNVRAASIAYRAVSKRLESLLAETQAAFGPVAEWIRPKPIAISIQPIEGVTGEFSHFDIKDSSDQSSLAGVYTGRGLVGAYLDTTANLDKFVAVFNHIRHEMAVETSLGRLSAEMKGDAGVIIGASGEMYRFDLQEFDFPISTYEIIVKCPAASESLAFLRINTGWFDVSFERAGASFRAAVASHVRMASQFSFFLSELIAVDKRGAEFAAVFKGMFENAGEIRGADAS